MSQPQPTANPDLKTNPLLAVSTLPHGAFPFDKLQPAHFLPALEVALTEGRANLDRIRQSKEAPTFTNTVLALETASEAVGRVSTIFFNLLGTNSNDELQAMARDISPRLTDFSSDVLLDSVLFQRVKAVWENRAKSQLAGEDLRLTEKSYKDFVRNGGLLNEGDKAKLREIDQKLSTAGLEFSDNVLKATNDFKMWIDNEADLAGLPASTIEAAAQAAKETTEPKGKWLFTLQGPSYVPFLTYSSNRTLREKLWRAQNSRAFRDSHDNEPVARKISQLRRERAKLLGYRAHADFVLEERMAETPAKVITFLQRMLSKTKTAAERDVAAVRALRDELSPSEKSSELMSWDYAHYAEKLKMRNYSLDQEQLRPYFKLENVVQGVFEHARRLYGLKFKEIKGIPVSHADVKTYEVLDEASNKYVGLFYADFFPRESKRGGAWMSTFQEQGLQGGTVQRPQATIVCNFTKPTSTKPSLLTYEEVSTLFHEFGHSLHALLSDCKYVSLGGTNVFWDFVELPSQIMENWALEKEALDLFAVHYETGEKIPTELTEKIRASARFQAGYTAVRQLQFALLDMAWHSHIDDVGPTLGLEKAANSDEVSTENIEEFEKRATSATTLLPRVAGTNNSCSFSHIFAGGYSAGYYSYKWAEVLDADAFELFKEKGLFNVEVARSFRENILSRGGTSHPMELYKKFRGREPDPDALLRRDGLI